MENDDFSERHDFREEKTFVLVDTTKKKKRAYGRRVASRAWHACVRCTGVHLVHWRVVLRLEGICCVTAAKSTPPSSLLLLFVCLMTCSHHDGLPTCCAGTSPAPRHHDVRFASATCNAPLSLLASSMSRCHDVPHHSLPFSPPPLPLQVPAPAARPALQAAAEPAGALHAPHQPQAAREGALGGGELTSPPPLSSSCSC